MQIIQSPSPNRGIPPRPRPIRAVVLHSTEGGGTGALSWLRNPASGGSAHYLILEDGTVHQLVQDGHVAWHVKMSDAWVPPWLQGVRPQGGWSSANECTIGIEIAGFSPGPFTTAQRERLVELVRTLCGRFGIPASSTHIVYHSELQSDRHDPQPRRDMDLKDWLLGELNGGELVLTKQQEDALALMAGIGWGGREARELEALVNREAHFANVIIPDKRKRIDALEGALRAIGTKVHETLEAGG